LTATGNVWRVS